MLDFLFFLYRLGYKVCLSLERRQESCYAFRCGLIMTGKKCFTLSYEISLQHKNNYALPLVLIRRFISGHGYKKETFLDSSVIQKCKTSFDRYLDTILIRFPYLGECKERQLPGIHGRKLEETIMFLLNSSQSSE